MRQLTVRSLFIPLLALSVCVVADAQTTTTVDTQWVKSDPRLDPGVLDTLPPDHPAWNYTSVVWNGGPVGVGGCPIPEWQPGFWAPLSHLGGCFAQATHQWFRTTLELERVDDIETIELVPLFRPDGRIGVNDNLYVWVNAAGHTAGEVVAYGGSSEIVPQAPFPQVLLDRLDPTPVHGAYTPCGDPDAVAETSINIEVAALPASLFAQGVNLVDVLLEEFCITGGMSHLAFRIHTSVAVVEIDIKPGSDPNCFNINGHGVIPVAVLGSESFNVVHVDQASLLFGGLEVRVRGNKGPLCSFEQVNGDIYMDLVCHFEDDPAAWSPGEDVAMLEGVLYDGTPFEGVDGICVVPE